jgi:uncharacterized protein DUF1924
MRTTRAAAAILVATAAIPALAAAPGELQKRLESEARAADPAFAGFSAQRGGRFFSSPHGNDWSCASCHTENPAAAGRHAKTGKTIAPLAPAANPERFTDAATAEKWFRRNCNDVLGRACTAQEKGDVLQYLMSLR